jgi:isoamylase
MITAGDEFARTQKGNNNSWCQDNETSWLDWSLLDTHHDYLHFFQKCIQLRKSHKVFRRDQFFSSTNLHNQENSPGGITWQYLKPGEQNWNPDCHGLAFLLCGDCEDQKDSDFFIMLNGNTSESLHFTPPSVPSDEKSGHWHRIIDTAAPPPGDFTEPGIIIPTGETIEVQPFGIVVLQAR